MVRPANVGWAACGLFGVYARRSSKGFPPHTQVTPIDLRGRQCNRIFQSGVFRQKFGDRLIFARPEQSCQKVRAALVASRALCASLVPLLARRARTQLCTKTRASPRSAIGEASGGPRGVRITSPKSLVPHRFLHARFAFEIVVARRRREGCAEALAF